MPSIHEELRRMTRLSRPRVRIRLARVVRTTSVTPNLRRITLRGDLDGCDSGLPADAWKFMLPPPGRTRPDLPVIGPDAIPAYPDGAVPPIMRSFTGRFDPVAGELVVDVVLHGAAPGPVWARTARPGDEVGLAGPRHEFFAAPEAEWHLLAGDSSAVPAIAAILESLPGDVRVVAFIEVGDEADRIDIAAPAGAELTWLYRRGAPPQHSDLLEKAVRALDRPFGRAQAWVAAEADAVRAIRRHLLDERGLPRPALHAAAYWKHGRTNEQRDTDAMAAYASAVAAGADPDDPSLILEPDPA